jgi:hypothetical protein
VSRQLTHSLTIRLDPETLQKLEQQAQRKGIGVTTLIRIWIMERMEEQELSGKGNANMEPSTVSIAAR